VLVVEDKVGFVELQVKEALYGRSDAPEIFGKRGLAGRRLIPADGELTAARLLGPLHAVLKDRVAVSRPAPPSLALTCYRPGAPLLLFGCPHNRSGGSRGIVGRGGIGWSHIGHDVRPLDSKVTALTQMAGSAQWIGRPRTRTSATSSEHRRRNIFPLRQLALQACLRWCQHHLQDSVQLGGGDDWRSDVEAGFRF